MINLLDLLGIPIENGITAIIIILLASILILLLLRGFWCWFFKTTEISYFLEEISDKITAQHQSQLAYYETQLDLCKKQIEKYNYSNNETTDDNIEEKPQKIPVETQKIKNIYE